MKKNPKLWLLLLAVVLTIPAIFGLLNSGFFVSDDGNWMVVRFSAFFQALKSGQFPVRYLFRLNNSFGYPVADFLYPLYMYIATPAHILGLNFVNSIKFVFATSMIFSTVFSFLWLRRKFSNFSSLIGSLIYTYFPYHLFDLYKRGSIGEILGLSIVPFIFWQIERRNLLLTSLGIGLLILSHNTIAFLFTPIILIYLFLQKVSIKKILYVVLLALGLSAFFWLPALYDSRYTIFSQTNVSDFSKYFIDLSLVGFISLIVFIFSFFMFKKKDRNFIYFFLLFTFFIFITTSYSDFFWNLVPFKEVIQFPFRLLAIPCLAIAYLSAYEIDFFKKTQKYVVGGVFLIVLILSSYSFMFPKEYQYFPDSYYSTNVDTTTVRNEYMPKWVIKVPTSLPENKVSVIDGKGEILNLEDKGNKVRFGLSSADKALVSINSIYFPGWNVKVNGENVPIKYENEGGLIQFDTEKGNQIIEVYFSETPLRLFADGVSIISICLLIYFLILRPKFLLKKS